MERQGDGTMTKRTAWELMNPDPEELEAGDRAVRALIDHAKRMQVAVITCPVSDETGEWLVTVTWNPKSKAVN